MLDREPAELASTVGPSLPQSNTTTIIPSDLKLVVLKARKTQQQQQQSLCIIATLRFRAIGVYKRKEIPPQFFGGGFSKLYQVTSQTQLSRPITLGHYTSWSADSAGNNIVCDVTAAADQLLWKHFCVDTHFSWVPRRLGE